MSETFVVGDIHGQFDKLVSLLQRAKLINQQNDWCGGANRVYFLGDFFDRGPDGIAGLDLVMRVQRQATNAGGQLHALMGNHDALMIAVHRFGFSETSRIGGLLVESWQRNGGRMTDLQRIKPQHIDWLMSLPAMLLVGDRLLVHADAYLLYTSYGRSIEAVNRNVFKLMRSHNEEEWERFLTEFSERMAFFDDADMGVNGAQVASDFLRIFGGLQVVHGHTPIPKIIRQPPEVVTKPLVYANGLAINIDGGMYLGGPGFAYRLPSWIESIASFARKPGAEPPNLQPGQA
jgi:hypothetical protein